MAAVLEAPENQTTHVTAAYRLIFDQEANAHQPRPSLGLPCLVRLASSANQGEVERADEHRRSGGLNK